MAEAGQSQAQTETIEAINIKKGERTPDPCIVVIFGASGDLTKRKLLPALYHLEQQHLLPKDFAVVGVARRDLSGNVCAGHAGWHREGRRRGYG